MKNATLETELNSIKIEKKQLRKEFDSFKEEKRTEFKVSKKNSFNQGV